VLLVSAEPEDEAEPELEDEAEPEEAFEIGGGAVTTGVVETIDIVEAEDVTEGGDIVEGDEKTRGGGLSPPAPSSVDPSGMPTGLTDDRLPIPAGDEADAAGCNNVPLPPPAHAPDAVPALPPPSKSAVEPDVPDVKLCIPEHVAVGLTPGDTSSVAPRGVPAGATGELGPMPSGDVMPSGDGSGEMPMPPTCAKAGLQTMSVAVIATINERVSVGFFPLRRCASPSVCWG
jgi:hypothetical protein